MSRRDHLHLEVNVPRSFVGVLLLVSKSCAADRHDEADVPTCFTFAFHPYFHYLPYRFLTSMPVFSKPAPQPGVSQYTMEYLKNANNTVICGGDFRSGHFTSRRS